MPSLPALEPGTMINHSPHVVLLGAGASIAATYPNGDKFGKQLPAMNNLVEVLGMQELIADYGVEYKCENFEAFYDDLVQSGYHRFLVAEIEAKVFEYFSSLQLPDEPTIYDYLVLSLRPKDIIATFNWDPFLAQAFQRNLKSLDYKHAPQVVFLHGNVEIGMCLTCRVKGWRKSICSRCKKPLEQSKLLYPVGKKDYNSDPFLKSEWDLVQAHLERAYFVTVFGYSAPVTDKEARQLLRDAWGKNQVTELAQINFVDIQASEKVLANWQDFIVRDHASVWKYFFETQQCWHPRRSGDAFAQATLQLRPWEDNPFPKFETLKELQDWVQPLIKEEVANQFSGNPC